MVEMINYQKIVTTCVQIHCVCVYACVDRDILCGIPNDISLYRQPLSDCYRGSVCTLLKLSYFQLKVTLFS